MNSNSNSNSNSQSQSQSQSHTITTYQGEQAIAEGLGELIDRHHLHDLPRALSTALLARILVTTAPASGLTQQDLYNTLVPA